MFTRTVLFFFCFVGMFAIVFAAMPSGYLVSESLESSSGMDKEIAEQLTLANLTVYDVGANDNMTYDYTSLDDSPSPPSWKIPGTESDYLEVWWGLDFGRKAIELRHATPTFYGWASHRMNIQFANGTWIAQEIISKQMIERDKIIAAWDPETNASGFYGECEHAYSTILFTIHNTTRDATIGDAWDNNEIDYILSYEKNWNATNINAMTLMSQLLSFQNPNLGVPGFTGTVMNYAIALPFWVITAIAIIKLIQSIIPWIKGVED